MKLLSIGALSTALLTAALPLMAAPNSVWNAQAAPALPLRYIESAPVLRLTP